MKILQVHNFYREPGGEDRVLEQEYTLLTEKGHPVHQYTKSNKNLEGPVDKFRLLLNTHYSRRSYREMLKQLDRVKPDLVHVHNFFPQFSPSIFWATAKRDIPSVLTLHNYRLIHPNAKLTAHGKIDERSIEGSAYEYVWDGVYRNSKLQTAVVAHMIEYHRRKGTWHRMVNRFIALSEFCKTKFVEGGLPAGKIEVKPNFIFDDGPNTADANETPDPYFVYAGRMSREKGVETLVQAWLENEMETPLFMLGKGPLMKEQQEKSADCNTIKWMGRVQQQVVYRYLSKATALVFPSEWYECFPLVLLESFAAGTPVVTSDIGSQQSIVDHRTNGLHFEIGNPDDLVDKIYQLEQEPDLAKRLGKNARHTYENCYTPQKNYEQLMDIYRSVIREQ